MALSARLEAIWYGQARPPWWLRAPAVLFGLIAARRRRRARAHALPVPVLVVGNISVGGTGKSPVVAYLVDLLREMGHRPGVVARGYGGRARHWPQAVSADSDPAEVGDEPVMHALRLNCPVQVGPDRVAAVLALAERADIDVVVSDDGLQHYRMPRQVEIAVVDGVRGLGNGCLLPAGPLREAPERLLDTDLVMVNGGNWVGQGLAPLRFHLLLGDAVGLREPLERPLSYWREQTVHAVAGIGHPERFFSRLEAAGLRVLRHAFADHHRFEPADLDFGDALPVLMTDKDAVKCRGFAQANWFRVPVTVALSDAERNALRELIARKLAPAPTRIDEVH